MPSTNDEMIAAEYGLPELPEPVEDPDTCEDGELAQLAIARFQEGKIWLEGLVTLADAQEYCSRADTRDPDGDWFVCFYRR